MTVQLLGISNAIVDVLTHIDGNFLDEIGAVRGSMELIDEARAKSLYDRMGPTTEMSGGSVANSVAGFAILGGTSGYIGRVRDDQFGEVFNHDMRTLGIDIRLEPATSGASTARSYILIEDDGQRTMQTYLGACTELSLDDVTEHSVGSPSILLVEGYIYDIADGPQLSERAMQLVKANGGQVALSLSDSFCVDRHRDAFLAAVESHVDIVIADEDEVNALFETERFEDTLSAVDGRSNLFVMTRSAKGSVIVHGDEKIVYPATPVDPVVDTTGAGDAYCAGFLYGWANEASLEECARLGTLCATEVIQRVGARIEPGILERAG